MGHTVAADAMLRSFAAVLFVTVVLLLDVLPAVEPSVNSVERVATVELLPNDLIQVDREQEETIATPVQVIEKHVAKTWQTIVRQMLADTRTGMKHKRTLGAQPNTLVEAVRLFMMLLPFIQAGLIPLPVSSLPVQPGALPVADMAGVMNNPLAVATGAASMGTAMVPPVAASNPYTGTASFPGGSSLSHTPNVQDMATGGVAVHPVGSPGYSQSGSPLPGFGSAPPPSGSVISGPSMMPGSGSMLPGGTNTRPGHAAVGNVATLDESFITFIYRKERRR
uniref:Uncharacterized protein n=1 Tax=Anopheles quadriannulatus TaxID=34691 RepID=A0A182WT16_ANOQN